ncbi:peptide chain release factor N(5)-glutamine methyltransferase [Leptolyngbya sp. 15MV]|nr:peptide chain release factor N(5)-glutamine methyltransferase [Leptolyngbya sp. 15MV]
MKSPPPSARPELVEGPGTTVAQAIRAAADRLAATSDTARLDAELLMAHALGLTRSDMLLRAMREPVPPGYAPLVARRIAHEPVAYIVGHQEFHGLDLAVTPAVLIPRADSETLIEAAREAFGEGQPASILDLGTGSGALLLAALSLWPEARGIGIDASVAAVAVAAANAAKLAPLADCAVLLADWRAAGWADRLGRFDLILCNPPYVEDAAALDPDVRLHEPHAALFAGAEGLDDYRVLIPQLPSLLSPGGIAVFEIGYRQAESVGAIAREHGFAAVLRHDLAGRPRALILSIG